MNTRSILVFVAGAVAGHFAVRAYERYKLESGARAVIDKSPIKGTVLDPFSWGS